MARKRGDRSGEKRLGHLFIVVGTGEIFNIVRHLEHLEIITIT